MRKFIFLILLLCSALVVRAGSYFSGTDQLYNLLLAVDATFTINDDNGDRAGTQIVIPDDNKQPGTEDDWWTITGLCFLTLSGECGVHPTPVDHSHATIGTDDAIALPYQNSGDYTYWVLRSIDWSNKGYHQKDGYTLTLEQYPNPPAEPSTNSADNDAAQGGELRWLESLNFSGNYFTSFSINGHGLLDKLSLIDFSNNPTLQSLSVTGCTNPDLKVDISQNGFSFGKIWELVDPGFLDNNQNIVPWLYYGNQGIVRRAFPHDNVDLGDDTYGFSQPTTYAFTTLDGTPITPTDKGNGVFAFDASLEGQKVYCTAKCGYFTQLPDGITFLITLVDDLSMLSSVNISPQTPEAYLNEPVSLRASAVDFNGNNAAGNVTVKWESASGTFDDDASLTPIFMPTAAGAAQIKCTATQQRAGEADVVESQTIDFTINPARIIESINAQFKFDVYKTGEDAPFTITTEDQYGLHTGLTAGIQITATEGVVDVANKKFTAFQKGFTTITFDAGTVKQYVDLVIIDDDPLSALSVDASSYDPATDDGYGNARDFSPEMAIDGDHSTRWASDPAKRNTEDTEDNIVVDLGDLYDVCMIEIDWETARPSSWNLSVSEDGVNWDDGDWGTYTDADMANMGNNHYISRILGESKVRYMKVDCFSRATSYDYSIFEITAYGGTLSGSAVKTVKLQSGPYYNGNGLIITGDGKSVTGVYSLTGQKVLSGTASQVDVSALSKGCYIAKIVKENGTVSTLKFIK